MIAAAIVGRDPEVRRLDDALDGLEQGTLEALVVEGEPGIGKTRLLEELRRRAEQRGHLVLTGSAAEFEREMPFGVWVAAMDAYVASREPHLDPRWEAELVVELAGVLPGLRREEDAAEPSRADGRYHAHRAVRRMLELIAHPKPLVLVLDDLHWADAASVELIAALMRRGSGAPVLLALAHRSGQAPAGLLAALSAPGVMVVELAPLNESECAGLAGAGLSSGQRAAIFRESGGNPFYALQLARSSGPPSRSVSGNRIAAEAGVPRVVAAALMEELQALGPAARALLDAGAIAGDPFDPELAFEIGQLAEAEGVAALDGLLATGLLRATEVPRQFAFRHPLVRRAVYEAAGGGWRLGAHARAARALAGRAAAPAVRAHHVEQAAAHGDRDAIALLLAAGDASVARAPAGAARWYAAALRLMPGEPSAERLAAVMRLAQAWRSVGDLARCRESLIEAIELVPPDGTVLRLRLASACAISESFMGRHEPARARLEAAFEAFPERLSPEAVAALLDLAAGAFFTMDDNRMLAHAHQALATARVIGHGALIGSAASMVAHAAAIAGRVADSRTAAAESGAGLDDLPEAELAARLDAVNRLAWALLLMEAYEAADRQAARGARIARSTGQAQFLPLILGSQSLAAVAAGRLAEAAEMQQEAIEAARLTANDYVTCSVLTYAGHIAAARGDLEEARRAGEESVAIVGDLGGRIAQMAEVRLAVTMRELGEPPASLERLVASAGGWELSRLPAAWRVVYHEALARLELDAGRPDRADAHAGAAERDAAALTLPVAGALAARARAGVLLAAGHDPATAAQLALRSAEDAAEAGARLESARSRIVAGRALAAAGERAAAVLQLRAAEAATDEMGAVRDRAEARRELRHLGARPDARSDAVTADGQLRALSSRERQVADLVADRRTNREIAKALYLSEKTIETHLRNIFGKLGASSRAEVARAVERSRREEAVRADA